jgi:hypothetical protein
MQNNSTEYEDVKSIRINSELYDHLRDYCDAEHLRFKDFVEDWLELAVDFNERTRMAETAEKMLNQVQEVNEKAYKHGFTEGFYVGFNMAMGNLWTGLESDVLTKNIKNNPPKPVEGPQMKLF